MSFQRSNPAAFNQANWTSELVGFCLRKDCGVCRARVKHKSGSCRREGSGGYFYPSLQPCSPWVWWTIEQEPPIPAVKGLTRNEELDLRVPRISTLPNTASFSVELQAPEGNVLAHLHGEGTVSSHFPRSKSSLQHVLHGRRVFGRKGHGGDGRHRERWSTRSYIFSPPLTQIFLCLAKKGGLGVEGLPWMVFTSHRSTTVFLIKPSRAQPGAPCTILRNISHCFGGLLTRGRMHSKIFQVILS